MEVDPTDVEVVKKAQVARDKELDELNALLVKHDQQDDEIRNKEATEASRRTLWTDWNVERMQAEVIKKLKIYWMETNISFSMNDEFTNVAFKARRGVSHELFDFTLADLPLMNPYDWSIMFSILSKVKIKYEPIIQHLYIMIKTYIQEISKMDVEITTVLKIVPILKPFPEPEGSENLRVGFIQKYAWGVVYKANENGVL
ncbi:unnamed protein product [Lactuca saligna]|uniref:Uncharacterized protein n=1 Tax=Lactuca saligna TaxID=75948 RepID=A0AA36EEZ1_LACSI|nr:unnamed protein product [Lactuca saligna]